MTKPTIVTGANPMAKKKHYPVMNAAKPSKREEEARIWISGIEAVKAKIGVKVVYDLSATPFFLRGSGYDEGTLFPWVVSDFSLIDAIESGIVKVPRVPVADDSMIGRTAYVSRPVATHPRASTEERAQDRRPCGRPKPAC